MTTLLRINTSIFDSQENRGVSTQLSDQLLEKLLAVHPQLQIITRDFATDAVPHLDARWLQALSTPVAERSAEQQAKANYSDGLVSELQTADILVIGAPMYNFSVPSMLKAWIDHVARAGVSFRYTESGPIGLLGTKKVYIVASFGGKHESGASDFVRPYLQTVLGLLGLSDIEIITADGLNMGAEHRTAGLLQAQAQLHKVEPGLQQFLQDRQLRSQGIKNSNITQEQAA